MQMTGQKFTIFVKNVQCVELHGHIWNHHEKWIQISTNIPSFGLVICEIGFEFYENNNDFYMIKPTIAYKVFNIPNLHLTYIKLNLITNTI